MGRKFEVTGEAVVYTEGGAKIVDAEVRRVFNAHHDANHFKLQVDGKYLLVGGARTKPSDNPYAQAAYHPKTVEHAFKYSQTKFFRLILTLMRLAQWEPLHNFNLPMNQHWFTHNQFCENEKPDVDFDKTLSEIDEQFYRKYNFTLAMIKFVEEHFL